MRLLKAGISFSIAIFVAQTFVHPAGAKPRFYMSDSEFLATVFAENTPQASTLIVAGDLRERIEAILDHRFSGLRLRYWQHDDQTAWVLDEIGKTEPITIGVSVQAGRVGSVRVLEYRESRGSEVRFPYFTDQFLGAELEEGTALDRPIDGITGATMSVDAVQKVVRVALLLDEHIRSSSASNEPASY
jgi:hypothetical protein